MKAVIPILRSISLVLVLALGTSCGGDEEIAQDALVNTPTTSSTAPDILESPTPAIVSESPGPGLVAIELDAIITEPGAYLLEVAGRRLWRNEGVGSLSPDSHSALRSSCCTGGGGLDVVDIFSGQATRLVDGDISSAAWSPDGESIAFSFSPSQGLAGLYVINRDGTGQRRLTDSSGYGVQWLSGGNQLAFVSSRALNLVRVADGEVTELTDTSNGLDSLPDGGSIIFADDAGLYIYNLESSERRVLATGPSYAPHLSPDGARIAFYFGEHLPFLHSPATRAPVLHILDLSDSSGPVRIPPALHASWSPDGTRLAYSSHGCITGEWDLYVANADGSSGMRLTHTPQDIEEGPEWSPSDSKIAYSTIDKLVIVDADSGMETTLITSAGAEAGADLHLHENAWSHDGRYMSFAVGFGHGVCD